MYNGPDDTETAAFDDLEGAGVSLYSSHSITTNYGVGTSNINIFGPVAQKLPIGYHYVYWREGQYVYKMAYGKGLSFDGSRFVGDGLEVVTYQTYSGSGSGQASFLVSGEDSFSLSPGNYLVWSDLGHYPDFSERGVKSYVQTAVYFLFVCFAFYLFQRVLHGWRR